MKEREKNNTGKTKAGGDEGELLGGAGRVQGLMGSKC